MESDINQDTPDIATGVGPTPDSETPPTTPVYGSEPAAFSDPAAASRTTPSTGVGETKEQWQKIGEQTSVFLAELPRYVSEFFRQYRRPILTVGLILGTILLFKVALAILGAINDIPLLAPTFELIGIGYAIWFVYRYLLKASNRAELSQDVAAVKAQILGGTDRLLDRFSSEDKAVR
ncbi:MAG: CAAD domain-containing protein [Elainellaceae cyanobacterium]